MKFLPCGLTNLACLLATTLLFSAVGWSAPSSGDSTAQEQVDVQAIDALSKKDIAACMKDDVDTLCSLWTDDGVLLMPGAPPLVGKKAICGMLQQQKASAKGAFTTGYTEEWQEVRMVGNYAWQWGEMSQTQADTAGKQQTTRVNAIRILRREKDGSWKVARAAVTPAGQ